MLVKTRSYCLEQAVVRIVEAFNQHQQWHLAISHRSLGNPHRPGTVYEIAAACQKRTSLYSLTIGFWPHDLLYPIPPCVLKNLPDDYKLQCELESALKEVPIVVTLKQTAEQLIAQLKRLDKQGKLPRQEQRIDHSLVATLIVSTCLPGPTNFTFSKKRVNLHPLLT